MTSANSLNNYVSLNILPLCKDFFSTNFRLLCNTTFHRHHPREARVCLKIVSSVFYTVLFMCEFLLNCYVQSLQSASNTKCELFI